MQFKFQTFNNRYPKLESDASTLAQLLKETDSVTRVSVCYGESKILTKLFCITKYLVKENHVGLLLSVINFFFLTFMMQLFVTSCVYLFFWQTTCECISHVLII